MIEVNQILALGNIVIFEMLTLERTFTLEISLPLHLHPKMQILHRNSKFTFFFQCKD